MGILKKILANKFVKMLISPKFLKIALLSLVAIALLVVIFKWLRKKTKKKAGGEEEAKKITPKTLVSIWKKFKKHIPGEFRRSILLYQPVVVFGESGSGKSLLIDNYTDWKGQSYQFYPSYTTETDLQIYLGSQVLAQEVPASLLNDTSKNARNACINLWKRFFKKRSPLIIVTLKASALNSVTPEALRRQAQMIRGKINIISKLRGKPVDIRVVLTHMDQVDGYTSFASFLSENHIPLEINLKGMDLENELKHCLEPYEKYLSLALTRSSSKDYKKMLQFSIEVPNTLSALSVFLRTLIEYDPLGHQPKLDELYLISNMDENKISNPFRSEWPREILSALKTNLKRHKVACACVIAAVVGYFLLNYVYEKEKWGQTKSSLTSFQASPSYMKYKEAKQQMATLGKKENEFLRIFSKAFYSHKRKFQHEFKEGIKKLYDLRLNNADIITTKFQAKPSKNLYHNARKKVMELVKLRAIKEIDGQMITLFLDREKNVRSQFVEGIRKSYILPLIDRCKNSVNPGEQLLYLFALMYASQNNETGKLILKNPSQWAKNFDLPKQVIKDYILYSDTAWTEFTDVGEIPERSTDNLNPLNNPDPWIFFFLKSSKAFKRPFITPKYLEILQKEGKILEDVIEQVGSYSASQVLFDALDKETTLNIRKIYEPMRMTNWIAKNNKKLKEFFYLIRQYPIVVSQKTNKTLFQFNYNIKTSMLYSSKKNTFEDFKFQLLNRTFTFQERDWLSVIRNSKIVVIINSFIRNNQLKDDGIFFSGNYVLEDIDSNTYNNGDGFVQGKTIIPGRYTKEGFEKEVKAVLREFKRNLKSIPKALGDKRRHISNFIIKKVEDYSNTYYRQYERFYITFDVEAESNLGLSLILKQMRLPSSYFHEFLLDLAENTSLQQKDKEISEFVWPVYQSLKVFEPINKLVLNKDNPQLRIYQAILQKIQAKLDSENAVAEEEEEKKEEEPKIDITDLSMTLSESGRLTLPIFLDEQNSYLADTKRWLKSVGISEDWQKPFLAPIYKVYDLGLVDIEKSVNKNWKLHVLPILTPLLGKFPFHKKSERNILPEKLEATIHPTAGSFWIAFNKLIAPVCVKKNGIWKARKSFRAPFIISKDILKTVNHFQWLSKKLWDKEGNAQTLKFKVKTKPLTIELYKKRDIATLSYLSAGKSSVFNFNQKPRWKSFEIKWWVQDTSKVGMEFKNPEEPEVDNVKYSIVISDVLWSFFRLLLRSRTLEKDAWTWVFPETASDYTTTKVIYYIKDNPWKLFELELTEKE